MAQAGTGKYFCYDANGNMTRRNATSSGCASGGDTMTYGVENRMTSMVTGSGTTNFAHNGDGVCVSREVVGVGTTYYIGNYYEIYKPSGGGATINKYYFFGAQRVAARINTTLFCMQGDHLGSSSLVMTSGGSLQTRQTYFPDGAKRVADGNPLPTGMDTTFTVTRHHSQVVAPYALEGHRVRRLANPPRVSMRILCDGVSGQKSDDSTGLMFYGRKGSRSPSIGLNPRNRVRHDLQWRVTMTPYHLSRATLACRRMWRGVAGWSAT